MSDIKMSGVFDLPISYDFDFRDECGVDYRVIQDAKHKDVISDDTQLSAEQAKAAVHAINTHDAMQARIAELEKALANIKKYQETVTVGLPELSATWQIASRALEK